MKSFIAFLVTLFLLAGCSNQAPTPYPTIEPTPTLSTGYQVVGSTKNTYMVVVDPMDNMNREGLQSIGKRLCQSTIRCKVWFWDDISKADTAYPVDPDKEERNRSVLLRPVSTDERVEGVHFGDEEVIRIRIPKLHHFRFSSSLEPIRIITGPTRKR